MQIKKTLPFPKESFIFLVVFVMVIILFAARCTNLIISYLGNVMTMLWQFTALYHWIHQRIIHQEFIERPEGRKPGFRWGQKTWELIWGKPRWSGWDPQPTECTWWESNQRHQRQKTKKESADISPAGPTDFILANIQCSARMVWRIGDWDKRDLFCGSLMHSGLSWWLSAAVHAREQGSNKKTASLSCALSLVRQLYHMREIEAFTGEMKKRKTEGVSCLYCWTMLSALDLVWRPYVSSEEVKWAAY